MSTSPGFLIRDGLESDIDRCLLLDHTYETEHVWQMALFEEIAGWQVTFKTEHLPRMMEVEYPADQKRIRAALPDEHCFLVAETREPDELLGYLTMRNQPGHGIALVQDIVVSRPYRGHGIATRLLNVARQWAQEHQLKQLMIEVQTKNYPALMFCEKSGLRFCGFNDRYFQNGDIAVFFSQTLR